MRGTIVMLGLCTQPDSFVPFRAVTKEVNLVTSAFFNLNEYRAALDALDGGHAPPHAMITETRGARRHAARLRGAAQTHDPVQGDGAALSPKRRATWHERKKARDRARSSPARRAASASICGMLRQGRLRSDPGGAQRRRAARSGRAPRKNYKIRATPIAVDLGAIGGGTKLADAIKAVGLEVDVVVNNAGYGRAAAFADTDTATQLGMIDLNDRALVELTHIYWPHMLAKSAAGVLNVASTAAFQPGPLMAIYYASKAFVLSFTEALWEEARGDGRQGELSLSRLHRQQFP